MTITSNNTLQLDETRINELTPFLQRALPLARLGIRVFPWDARGKEPVMLASGRRLSPLKQAIWHDATIVAQWGGREFADCMVAMRAVFQELGVAA